MEKNRGNYNEIVTAFRNTHSVDKTVIATGAPKVTVQKVLITEGLWESRRSREIAQLKDQGLSTEQIAEKLHVTVKAVQAYISDSRMRMILSSIGMMIMKGNKVLRTG